MASPSPSPSPSPQRVRRKPVPKLDLKDAVDISPVLPNPANVINMKRASFALYPDPVPVQVLSAAPTSSPSVVTMTSSGAQPHYTRRRANTALATPLPSPTPVPEPAPPRRGGLARLQQLLPHHSHGHSPRKPTISSPTPADFPPELLPLALSTLPKSPAVRTRDLPRPTTLHCLPSPAGLGDVELGVCPGMAFGVGVPPLALQVSVSTSVLSSPTSRPTLLSPLSASSRSSSSSDGSRFSSGGETAGTSPPLSPLSPLSPLCPISPTSPLSALSPSGGELKQSPSMKLKRKGSGKIVKRRPSVSVSVSGASTPPNGLLSRGRMLLRRRFRLPTTPNLLTAGTRSTTRNRRMQVGVVSPSTRTRNRPPSPPSRLPRAPPSPLPRASRSFAPSGVRVAFGELLGASSVPPLAGEDEEGAAGEVGHAGVARRTLVVFLRHFWCPLCQDYMVALARGVRGASGAGGFYDYAYDYDSATATAPSNAIPPSLSELFCPPSPTSPTSAPAVSTENKEACPACAASGSVTFAYLESLVGPHSPSPVEGENGEGAEASEWAARACAGLCDSAAAEVGPRRRRAPAGRATTTLKIVEEKTSPRKARTSCSSPPARITLAERYLASFAFGVPSEDGDYQVRAGFDLGDPLVQPGSPRVPVHAHTAQKPGKRGGARGGIASVRLFVDPRPAEGVYAALGMGWAVGGGSKGGSPAASAAASPVVSPTMSPTVPTFAREREPASPTEAAHGHGHGSPPGSISRAFSALRRRESELGCGFEEEEMCVARDGEDLHAHFATDSPLVPVTYNPHAHLGSGLDSAHDDDPHAAPATPTTANSTPTLRCTYAHRMQTTRGHASVARVLAAAGVRVPVGANSASNEDREAQRLVRAVSGSRASRSVSGSTSLKRSTSTSAVSGSHSRASGALPRSVSVAPGGNLSARPETLAGAAPLERTAGPALGVDAACGWRDVLCARGREYFHQVCGAAWGTVDGEGEEKEKRGREDLHHSALLEDAKDDSKANDVETTPRERPQIPRSASTPPLSISARASAIWENRERHGWAHVPHWGAGVGVIWEGDDAGVEREREGGGRREPAMRATLSASSSRPWALAAASLGVVRVAGVVGGFGDCVQGVREDEVQFDDDGVGVGVDFGVDCSRASSEDDGDDERSDREDARRGEHLRGLVRRGAKYGYGHGHARAQSEYAGAVHGHAEEEGGDGYEYGFGYEGDGYGSPVDGEDVWMRARAQSLARLRARKEVRRGGGADEI
ncbi:hypothetical protein B0H14DRAFT_3479981 [Mycena olivaceomarginata]|nr:hypothetical protein B0H14DRAFT_3479981 [Mycena olivaceomarginata]